MSNKIIGIDLGTGNSCVSFLNEAKQPEVISNAEGFRTTPSIVSVGKDGAILVGPAAKRQAITNPENTVFSVKRLIGRKYSEVKDEKLPYKVVEAPNGDAYVEIGGKTYSPQEISSMVLQKLKTDAETFLGEEIKDAVITVPAYFNDSQRQATKDAGTIAGLNVVRIVNEPTAAALAYGLDKKEGKIAVADFGCGTYDVSILDIGDGVFEVISTNGDTHLGGDDIDEAIIQWIADEFKQSNGIDLRADKMALQRLKEAAEKAKCELSTAQSTDINLPFITADATGPKHLQLTLSRAKMEQIAEPIFERLIPPCKQALKDAGNPDVDEVILVGGSTRIPKVVSIIKEVFGKEPSKGVNPDEVVSMGASIQGGVISGDVTDMVLLDVTPLTLGIQTMGDVVAPIIPRNTTIPTKKSEIFSTAADNQPGVEIVITQGERKFTKDNKLIGRFLLDGLLPAPRGVPQIEVTFDIDANGILTVSAKDLGTGKEQHITIQASSGLTDAEIEKMRKDAEAHEAEDAKRKEAVDARNTAESATYQAEKLIKEHGDKVDTATVETAKKALEELKEELKGNDTEKIKSRYDALMTAIQGISQEIYSKANPGSSPHPDAGNNPFGDTLNDIFGGKGTNPGSDSIVDV